MWTDWIATHVSSSASPTNWHMHFVCRESMEHLLAHSAAMQHSPLRLCPNDADMEEQEGEYTITAKHERATFDVDVENAHVYMYVTGWCRKVTRKCAECCEQQMWLHWSFQSVRHFSIASRKEDRCDTHNRMIFI